MPEGKPPAEDKPFNPETATFAERVEARLRWEQLVEELKKLRDERKAEPLQQDI